MEQFYLIAGASNILVYVLAVIELAVILAFLFAQKWSYGLVLLMHAISTLASYKKYLDLFQPPNRSLLCCDSDVSSLLYALLPTGRRRSVNGNIPGTATGPLHPGLVTASRGQAYTRISFG